MRQSMGGTWVFMLVIIFTMIFAAYIALTINYSKSFRIKNEVLSLIEKNEGFTNNGVTLINNYLSQSGYKTMGTCKMQTDTIVYGATSIDPRITNAIKPAQEGEKYYYCFSKYTGYHTYFTTRAYYKITLFFKFDLPVFHEISTFDVDGQTSEIDATYDASNLIQWQRNS